MNKKQLIVAWMVSLVICLSIINVIKLNNFYAHGYRAKDRSGNIIRFTRVGHKDVWNDVLKKPLIFSICALLIGGLLIYILKDKKK